MKKALIKSVIISILAICTGGCVTVGKPFPNTFAKAIVIGQTTQQEVEAKLGDPYRTGLDSGDRTATYVYYRIGLFAEPITSDLTIVYTPENIVKSYVFQTNQP